MRYWQLGLLAAAATLSAMYYMSSQASEPESSLVRLTKLVGLDLQTGYNVETGRMMGDLYENVIIIPDIHGDAEMFIRSLWMGVMEIDRVPISYENFKTLILEAAEKGKFPVKPLSDGKSLFVQLGDVVDRGPDSILCLRILWVVERVIGWPVKPLYGNHEIMSSIGVRREYVHDDEVTAFGSMTNRYKQFSRGNPLWDMITRTSFGMIHLDSIHEKKRTLFVHAGVDPTWHAKMERLNVPEYNEQLRKTLSSKFRNKDDVENLVNSIESPVWSRILAEEPDDFVCDVILPDIQTHMHVERIIVGHSPQDDHKMKRRCGGRIILADCAMSGWMFDDSGQAAILVFKNSVENDWESISAHYFDSYRGVSIVEHPEALHISNPTSPKGVEAHPSNFVIPEYPISPRKVLLNTPEFKVQKARFRDPKHGPRSPFYEGVIDIRVDRRIEDLMQIFRAYSEAPSQPKNVRMVDVAHLVVDSKPAPYTLFSVPTGTLALRNMMQLNIAVTEPIRQSIMGLHGIGVTLNTKSKEELLSMFGFDPKTQTVHLISLGKAEFDGVNPEDTIIRQRENEMRLVSTLSGPANPQ